MVKPSEDPAALDAVAALGEPTRRALYDAVIQAGQPLTREQAAERAGTTRALAAFHLDRLVEHGLLAFEYRRVSGRTGPGAGRPSKLYRRADTEVAVSLPPRHYDLAGELLAEAVDEGRAKAVRTALAKAARRKGRELGEAARTGDKPKPSRERRRAALLALRQGGFEPFVDPKGDIRLRNCPFHSLAEHHRDLVCGMNLELMRGLRAGSGLEGYTPELAPEPGACCVVFRHRKE